MRTRSGCVILCAVWCCFTVAVRPAAQEAGSDGAQEPLQVMFVGNSLTYYNDLPNAFARISKSLGHEVEVSSFTQPLIALEDTLLFRSCTSLIVEGLDYLVLQDRTDCAAGSKRPGSTEQAVRDYDLPARGVGAKPIIFVTWASGDEDAPKWGFADYESMQQAVGTSLREIAAGVGCMHAPVDLAWRTVLEEHPEIQVWKSDFLHPRPEGTYLAACVFYCVIFGEDPGPNTDTMDIAQDVADALEAVAARIVLDS